MSTVEDDETERFLEQARSLSTKLRLVLAGQPPPAIGAALVDVVSVWLAGHCAMLAEGETEGPGEDSISLSHEIRMKMLDDFVAAVKQMIPLSADEIGSVPSPKKH